MKSITVSLSVNESAKVFDLFSITQKGIRFISYDSSPPFDADGNRIQPKQRHIIRVSFDLEGFGVLVHEMLNVDPDNDDSNYLIWQGYKIMFSSINGHPNTEVDFLITELP